MAALKGGDEKCEDAALPAVDMEKNVASKNAVRICADLQVANELVTAGEVL